MSKKILVAEDSSVIQNLTKRILSIQNYKITSVKNGKQVLDKLAKDPFDLILLDINMPIVNGLDVLTLLKTKSPYKNIPVIMLCTSDDESYMNDSFSYGADAYLVKPINTEDFRFAIDNLRGVKL